MDNTPEILVDRMTGRASDEGLERDLSTKERVDRYLGAQIELDAALLARDAGSNRHDHQDIEEAVSILDQSARHWAAQITDDELELAQMNLPPCEPWARMRRDSARRPPSSPARRLNSSPV